MRTVSPIRRCEVTGGLSECWWDDSPCWQSSVLSVGWAWPRSPAGRQACTALQGDSGDLCVYLCRGPGHGEKQVQGDLQLLSAVHMPIAGGIGDDGLPRMPASALHDTVLCFALRHQLADANCTFQQMLGTLFEGQAGLLVQAWRVQPATSFFTSAQSIMCQ